MGSDLKTRKHLFFDLDDTLWDLEKNSSLVLQQLFLEFELETKLKVNFQDFDSTYKSTSLQLWDQFYKKEIDKQYLRNHRFNLTFNRFGYDNYEENLVITEYYRQRAPRGTVLKEGCIETLNYLKQNYTLHIITNGFKDVQDIKIDSCGLRHYFSNIIVSEDHQLLKPDKAIFRIAETLADTNHEHCVMIGDNFECDFQGALKAGWEAIYFGDVEDTFEGKRIKGLAELRTIF